MSEYYETRDTWTRESETLAKWHWYPRGNNRPARCGYKRTNNCCESNPNRPTKDSCQDCQYYFHRQIKRAEFKHWLERKTFQAGLFLICPAMLAAIVYTCRQEKLDHAGLFIPCVILTTLYSVGWYGAFKLEKTLHNRQDY